MNDRSKHGWRKLAGGYELFTGLRYIRSRGRNRFISFISLISMLGIALGVAVLIVVLAVMNGFEQELRSRILDMTAHATLTAMPNVVVDWTEAESIARDHAGVVAAAPFIDGQGMLVHGTALSAAMIRGVQPAAEVRVSAIAGYLRAGELAALEPGAYRIVLGAELAQALAVGIGDPVVLVIPQGIVTPAGIVPRMRRFVVAGVFSAGMYEYDRNLAYLHLEDAARLYRLEQITGLRLKLADPLAAPDIVRQVGLALGGGVYAGDWTQSHANFFRSIQLTKNMMFVILLMIVAVAAFNIVSTLVMVVRDKRSEIAILRTIGARGRSVMAIFMIQGVVIGLIGTIGGLALGTALAVNLERLVRVLERLLDTDLFDAQVYYLGELPARLQAGDLLVICATALALSFASTWYPAWRAARMRPAEVLRHE